MTPKFTVGEWVFKQEGSYKATGTIIAVSETSRGNIRYLFEFDLFPGMLHVFSEDQLQSATSDRSAVVNHLLETQQKLTSLSLKLGNF